MYADTTGVPQTLTADQQPRTSSKANRLCSAISLQKLPLFMPSCSYDGRGRERWSSICFRMTSNPFGADLDVIRVALAAASHILRDLKRLNSNSHHHSRSAPRLRPCLIGVGLISPLHYSSSLGRSCLFVDEHAFDPHPLDSTYGLISRVSGTFEHLVEIAISNDLLMATRASAMPCYAYTLQDVSTRRSHA